MIWPVIRRRPRLQRIFQLAVAPLHHPIAAWVKSCDGNVVDVQPFAQRLPDLQPELGAAVRGDDRRHTKAADPAGDQGIRYRRRLHVLDWNGFHPSGRDQSMMVKRYLNPSTELGSSPTKSTWR